MATVIVLLPVSAPAASAADPCNPVVSVIACENSKPGTPESVWDISGSGDSTIQGFATGMSVNVGQTESFKIKTSAPYSIDIYRLGWYGGDGARLITSVTPTPRTQPACGTIPNATGSSPAPVDCGNWAVSASWAVPSTAVSGVYIARLTRTDTGGASHIVFVVR
ncbi:MAG TPA: N,N-dimethylformamidase beta subunit family domain-containing protein, partial [Actinomycetes bacterium]